MTIVIIVLIDAALVWFFFVRNKSDIKRMPIKKVPVVHSKYHCVTVNSNHESCDAVKQLGGKRILSAEAPLLPLPGCDAESCHCKFEHHEERRDDDRRGAYNKAVDDISGSTITMKPRQSNDRRKSS